MSAKKEETEYEIMGKFQIIVGIILLFIISRFQTLPLGRIDPQLYK